MDYSVLSPVSDAICSVLTSLSLQTLGRKLRIHTNEEGVPSLKGASIAIVGVLEDRSKGKAIHLDAVRKALYALFVGSWHTLIVDLGDIAQGETARDTYYALKTTATALIKNKTIPVILGGTQDLTYANYRAYDTLMPRVNIVNVDSRFNLGSSPKVIRNDSFMGRVVLDQPCHLFNYAVIGYQTYFNSQEEKDLMDTLYFECYRLGDVSNDVSIVEPVMRDANLVSIDLASAKCTEIGSTQTVSPNGLDGRTLCAISRYAGLSNKVSSFGIYEYSPLDGDAVTAMLMAQIVWYFIEGVNFRVQDLPFSDRRDYQKYITLVDVEELVFYKSNKTGRWWIEMPLPGHGNSVPEGATLLPCTHQDYVNACNNEIPERWYRAQHRYSALL